MLKGQTWVTSLVKASQVARVARDNLVRWVAEETRVHNQAGLIPAVQVLLTETVKKMFPALKITIQTWIRTQALTAAAVPGQTGHQVQTSLHQTGLLDQTDLQETCDCTINYLREKSSGLYSFEDFFYALLEKMTDGSAQKFGFRQ